MKLVVLDSFAAVSTDLSLDCLRPLCEEITVYDRTLPQDTAARIGNAELVLTNKTVIDEHILQQCPNIRYIGLFATGYNVIDIPACKARGIVVANAPAYSTPGVAQLVFAFILHFYSLVDKHNREVHAGAWAESPDFCFYDPRISELSGKTLGLVGFGSIGRKVAQIAQAFDMNIRVFSRTVRPELEREGLRFVPLEEMLRCSDIVSLHCPLFPETTRLINRDTIALMKPSALLINTARGAVIDEADLAHALNTGKIAGAALDVATVEPISPDSPLLTAQNCVITPHIAWACRESRERLISIVYDNLRAFLEGHPQNNVAG